MSRSATALTLSKKDGLTWAGSASPRVLTNYDDSSFWARLWGLLSLACAATCSASRSFIVWMFSFARS
eukprot:8775002-Pyramimonas_sp.AAC.1